MGRRHHSHWLKESRPREYDVWSDGKMGWLDEKEVDNELTAICGFNVREKWNRDGRTFATEEKYVTCPKCRTKLAKQALKARPAGAPDLKLERDATARGGFRYQQGWRALVGGEFVAIVGFEEHYWHVYPLVARSPDAEHPEVRITNTHGVLTENGTTASRGMYRLPSGALNFATKEDALIACGDLRTGGKLKTGAELLAEYHAAVEANDRWQAQRRREVSERDQKNTDTLEALREILAHDTLSNFQREGLMNAIAIYEAKVRPPAEADEAA